MKGKFAFSKEVAPEQARNACETITAEYEKIAERTRALGLQTLRVYEQAVEGHVYLFQFYSIVPEESAEAVFSCIRENTGMLEGWKAARHVYEFKLHPGDTYENLKSQGIIIGVREGKLEEYIRLHDQQPQIIHDLCYQNGFRKSSIFVADLHKQYLLQFQDFSGQEDPALYEDKTYQEWLRVTGECQAPLPGEKFWKAMETVFEA